MSKKENKIKEKVLEKVEEAKALVEPTTQEPTKEEGSFKIKKVTKPKQLGEDKVPEIIKVDLTKQKEEQDAIQVGETKEVVVGEQTGDSTKVDESISKSDEVSETQEEKIESDSPLQEITDEEDNFNETGVDGGSETTTTSSKQEEILQETETQKLPENIEKLVKFMEETGGTVEDYARLNADYSNINEELLLHEYYKKAKPHLNAEEVNFIIEDTFLQSLLFITSFLSLMFIDSCSFSTL